MIRLTFVLAVTACQGISTNPGSNQPDATTLDAMELPISTADKEGGEIRLEWIQNTAKQTTARATAFFYKKQMPEWHPLPPFPGCADMRIPHGWPFEQGDATYVDVGGVIIHSPGGSDLALARDTSGSEDWLGRPHDLWWKKEPNFAANDGTLYFPPDEMYDVLLVGWSGWPALAYLGAAYMPATFTPISPPTDATFTLAPATDLTTTYTPGNNTKLPPHSGLHYRLMFTSPSFTDAAGIELPIVVCEEEGGDGALTVPAALVDIVRGYGSGNLLRQVSVHNIVEFTDGSPRATEDRKRVDIVTIQSYDTTWSAL